MIKQTLGKRTAICKELETKVVKILRIGILCISKYILS